MDMVLRLLQVIAFTALVGVAASSTAAAAGDLVRVSSTHSVAETIDRLAAAVKAAGANVIARVNHSKAAASIGLDIPDEELLIFGNPKIGSPVIRDAPATGLDLPLRVVAIEETGGTVMIYRDPAAMAREHGLPTDHPSIVKMTGALGKLTAKAAAE